MTSQQEEITTETIPQLFPALTFQALLPHPPPPYFSLLQSLIIKQTAEVKINFIREGVIRRQHALLDRVLFRSIELNWTCTDEFVGFIFYLYTKVAGDYCTALYVTPFPLAASIEHRPFYYMSTVGAALLLYSSSFCWQKKKHKQKMKNKTNKKQDGLLFNNISSSSRSLFHSRLIEGPCIIGVELMMMKIHVVVLLLRSCCSFSSTLFGTYG